MISPARAADLCASIYLGGAGFFHYDEGLDDGICWAIAQEEGRDDIVLRGSKVPEDWFDDVKAVPYFSRRLGFVHRGFYLGMDNAWSDMRPLLRPGLPVGIRGHSLGAARASILAGMMVSDGLVPDSIVVFGEPKPGFQKLADMIEFIPGWSFCNGNGAMVDPVTILPFTLPRALLNYVRRKPLTMVYSAPDPTDFGMFVLHHIGLYQKAVLNWKEPTP